MPRDLDQLRLGKHGGDRRSEKAKADQAWHKNDGSRLKSSEYNTKAHWTARLNRDRPDLAAQVRAGEISANAAAVLLGWRRPPTVSENQARKAVPVDIKALIG